ncbi:hypothetical protein ACFLUF_02430, partial [Chloroflexota bacterium]
MERALKQCPVEGIVDVPEVIFSHVRRSTVCAQIVAAESGIVAGIETLECWAKTLGLQLRAHVSSGSEVQSGDVIARIAGNPTQIVRGEDLLLGTIAKFSGVATAARTAVHKAGRIRVVCGGWKKMPVQIKDDLREAIKAGGVDIRMAPGPFIYLDKNYVRILGSLDKALESTDELPGRTVVIQLRGETAPIAEEAIIAARHGAQVLMVDTGQISDLRDVSIA